MTPTTLIAVSFRSTCEKRVDVRAAIERIAHGEHALSSNGGRTEHEGRLRVQAGTADEATTVLREALANAATAAGTSCEVTILSTRPMTGTG